MRRRLRKYRIGGFFDVSAIKTIEDLKKQYRNLAKTHHPDAGGSNEDMKLINLEFDRLEKLLLSGRNLTRDEQDIETQINEIFRDIIDSIIKYPGLNIEIIGNWIWVSGNTYPVKKQLKDAGFLFASKKKMWFWRPDEYKTRNRTEMTIDEIRAKYGTDKVNVPYQNRAINGLQPLSHKFKALQSLLRRRHRLQGIGNINCNNALG